MLKNLFQNRFQPWIITPLDQTEAARAGTKFSQPGDHSYDDHLLHDFEFDILMSCLCFFQLRDVADADPDAVDDSRGSDDSGGGHQRQGHFLCIVVPRLLLQQISQIMHPGSTAWCKKFLKCLVRKIPLWQLGYALAALG